MYLHSGVLPMHYSNYSDVFHSLTYPIDTFVMTLHYFGFYKSPSVGLFIVRHIILLLIIIIILLHLIYIAHFKI